MRRRPGSLGLSGGGVVTLSLNEVEALARKAARGSGFAWGIAEEAGKAARWLCASNVDGCAALADYLAECDGADLSDGVQVQGRRWTSGTEPLCPLLAGVALSDFADRLKDGELRLEKVAQPILLAPFAAFSAQQLEVPVRLAWNEACVFTDGTSLAIRGEIRAASAHVTARVESRFDQAQRQPACSRADPDTHSLAVLERLAHRTYAPATEASRLSGAGAGLSDND